MCLYQARALCFASIIISVTSAAADDQLTDDKAALARLQTFVGGWRGVGQPRRGSTQGAWTETADWRWQFTDGRAAIIFKSPKGKYCQSGTLTPAAEKDEFKLTVKRSDDAEVNFTGKLEPDGRLVLAAARIDQAAGEPSRITIRTVADGDRLLVLYEARSGDDRYTRLAEVGYTRVGAAFAKGLGEPECVVTGGVGTIAVSYQGKTYYVCCTGCRDLFNDDPEGVLAEYHERKAEERGKARP